MIMENVFMEDVNAIRDILVVIAKINYVKILIA